MQEKVREIEKEWAKDQPEDCSYVVNENLYWSIQKMKMALCMDEYSWIGYQRCQK